MVRPFRSFELAGPAASIAALVALTVFGIRPAAAQCGVSISGHFGGEVTAVAQVNASGLLVARGTWLEMLSLANPNAPASFSPPRRIPLPAPARKISMTAGSSRAFVLMENGDVLVATISTSPLLSVGFPATTHDRNIVDILADDQRVYVAYLDEDHAQSFLSSWIEIYDDTSGTPTHVRFIDPLTQNYGFDRLTRIGNTLWAGFHEFESSIFGIDAFNIANPSAPVRVTTSLNNVPLGTNAHVSAISAIGNRLCVSYHQNGNEDRLRVVDVSGNPSGTRATDLNAYASCMSSVGSFLRINFQNSAVGTFDTTNPAAPIFLGAYFDAYPNVSQIIAGGTTDYWAAGRAGLMTMNTSNPSAISIRAQLNNFPSTPSKVRQYGNTTAVLDYASNTLRLFDYTLPESQQLRGSYFLPTYAEFLELATLLGGTQLLACVGTDGHPGGDSISIIEITNPAAPVLRSTITGFSMSQLSASGSRLYAVTPSSLLKTYEAAQPLAPALRSTLTLNVPTGAFTCMSSWSNNALAIGTEDGGVLLMDTTNATAPILASTYNPVADYHVRAMAKGANYLYISAEVSFPLNTRDTRLESVSVTNLAAPVRRWLSNTTSGGGWPGVYDNLAYVSSPVGKFLVGTRPSYNEDLSNNDLVVSELPPGFLTNEGVPFPIATLTLPDAGTTGGSFYSGSGGNAAPNADGSRVLVSAANAGIYQLAMPVQWAPGFGLQPAQQNVCYGESASFTAFASGNPTAVTYQWYQSGHLPDAALVDGTSPRGTAISGVTTSTLTITNYHPGDLDFALICRATNSCGTTSAYPAYLNICPGDFNCSGITNVQDIFDFLSAWFAGDPSADVNGVGGINVQDIFGFLSYWFSGC